MIPALSDKAGIIYEGTDGRFAAIEKNRTQVRHSGHVWLIELTQDRENDESLNVDSENCRSVCYGLLKLVSGSEIPRI